MNIIDKLIEPYDNIFHAAKALGYDHQLLYQWKHNKCIPYRRGLEIEQRTNGRITASEVWLAASQTHSQRMK